MSSKNDSLSEWWDDVKNKAEEVKSKFEVVKERTKEQEEAN